MISDLVAEIAELKPPVRGVFWFLPWLTLPTSVRVGGFRFVPARLDNLQAELGTEIAKHAALNLARYVDYLGKPIKSCTFVLRFGHGRAWDIPESLHPRMTLAAQCLALAVMSEQRFFESPLSPHINATVFRPVGQGVVLGDDRTLSLMVRRRGGLLRIGGLKVSDVLFQMPHEAIGTACPQPSLPLVKALDRARLSRSKVWNAVTESLPYFLLGHAETSELPETACIMLSALAFERLLDLSTASPVTANANAVAESFAEVWAAHARRTVANAKRVKVDPHVKYGPRQPGWPVHRKWMKELYEVRSAEVHGKVKPEFSRNWTAEQHLVVAAFVYPLAIKLLLANEGNYVMTEVELGACDALDDLLDSHWGKGWKQPPGWSSILSMSEQSRVLRRIISEALDEATKTGG